MLSELYIKNYLLVPEMRLSLDKGLTVISGETGAGKSIVAGSISLIFGDNLAGIEAFDKEQPIYLEVSYNLEKAEELNNFLAQNGIETEEELILAREISPNGKSGYYVNGRKVGVSLLKELKSYLIDFHHQRDQQRLLSPSYQLDLLDAYADLTSIREEFANLYRELKAGLKKLDELKNEAERQKEINELYRFQYEELENAKLRINEDVELQNEYELLSHTLEITELCNQITAELLEQENSVFDIISGYLSKLKHYEHLNPEIGYAVNNMQQALENLQEASLNLSRSKDNISFEPQHLQDIQARLDLINSLVHKHKVRSIEELLNLFAERSAQIAAFADNEKSIAELEKHLEKNFAELRKKGEELSRKRQKSAVELSKELQENIRALSIPEGILKIRIDKKAEDNFVISDYLSAVSESGQDSVEFLFSANPGFELKPLSAVVSGGELSRILLAIKKVLADRLEPKLIILDEIESGIGGKTAAIVADFIAKLAERQQVLCITHLAQIAGRAEKHLVIEKFTQGEKSFVNIRKVEAEQRLQEIARMLSGTLTAKALEHAAEILKDINIRG
jgi:DNA repair protein RecN (Recombination protein N)